MNESVSVIIPAVEGGTALRRCLESVAGQDHDEVQVILIDNGSTPELAPEAAAVTVSTEVIRNEINLGFAPASNQGARASSSDWLLFLNSDAELSPGAVRRLVESAASHGAAVLQPLILDPAGRLDSVGDLFTWWGFMWHIDRIPSSPCEVFATKGACMLVRREVFEEVGGFESSYFAYFEESDLCWKARMRGHRVFVDPTISIHHIGGETTSRVLQPDQIYHLSFRNRLRSLVCNPSPRSLFILLPLHLVGCLGTAATFALRGRVAIAAAILKAITWPLGHIPEVLDQRRRAQVLRTLPDSALFNEALRVKFTAARAAALLKGTLRRWTQ